MLLRFVWVGKTKNVPIRSLIDDYLERIKRFVRVEITELRDRERAGKQAQQSVGREGEDILSKLDSDPFVVLLDDRGDQLDSVGMAELIERHRNLGTKRMTFVIGGPDGVSAGVRSRANFVLALSRLTLTHEMARMLLLEQIYRAFTLIHDLPYQR